MYQIKIDVLDRLYLKLIDWSYFFNFNEEIVKFDTA